MLQSMGLQRVRHDLVTEQQQKLLTLPVLFQFRRFLPLFSPCSLDPDWPLCFSLWPWVAWHVPPPGNPEWQTIFSTVAVSWSTDLLYLNNNKICVFKTGERKEEWEDKDEEEEEKRRKGRKRGDTNKGRKEERDNSTFAKLLVQMGRKGPSLVHINNRN